MEGSVHFDPAGFQAVRAKLDPAVRGHMRECGELTIRFSKDNSPYQTGHNRRSLTVDFYENGALTGSVAEGEFQPDPTAPPVSNRSNFGLKESMLE